MVQYYEEKNEQSVLRASLLDSEARKKAESLKKGGMTSAQLRRFYGEVKNLEKKATDNETGEISEQKFLTVLPMVKMMKSKVAYANNPSNKKVPDEFREWMDEHLDSIESHRDFRAFLLHFEAVVGFCYGLGLKNN